MAFLITAPLAAAHAQAPSRTAATATATVRGHVTDPTGALTPGAKIPVNERRRNRAALAVGFYKRGCQVKTLLHSREEGCFSDIQPSSQIHELFPDRGSPHRAQPGIEDSEP